MRSVFWGRGSFIGSFRNFMKFHYFHLNLMNFQKKIHDTFLFRSGVCQKYKNANRKDTIGYRIAVLGFSAGIKTNPESETRIRIQIRIWTMTRLSKKMPWQKCVENLFQNQNRVRFIFWKTNPTNPSPSPLGFVFLHIFISRVIMVLKRVERVV